MHFLQPWFLWGLVALAIPIIVHLFNFRRYKTIYFSNVAFLKEMKQETNKQSKLKHLLILASRLLALLFLILAFAQPYIPKRNTDVTSGKKYVSIYLDNSFSMNAAKDGISLLEKGKNAAREILKNYAADDNFQLLTNKFSGKEQRLVSKEEFLSMLDEVEISADSKNLQEIAKRQKDIVSKENSPNQIIYMLSDFQKSMGTFVPDSGAKYNLLPLAADEQSNVFIDSCWFLEPLQAINQSNQLIVKIKNAGEKNIENTRLFLKLNGQVKLIRDFSISSNSEKLDTLRFALNQAGFTKAELTVEDNPITYDDDYFLSFQVLSNLRVLNISESGSNLFTDALFRNNKEVEYSTASVNSLNYSLIKGKQLVLLSNLKSIPSGLAASLISYLEEGGSLAVFPAEGADKQSYNSFLNSVGVGSLGDWKIESVESNRLNFYNKLLKDIFEKQSENIALPKVQKYYSIKTSSFSGEEEILTLKNNEKLLSRYPSKGSSVYLSAVPLDRTCSDLPIHSLFAPLLFKMALTTNKAEKLAYTIGNKTQVEVEGKGVSGERIFSVKGKNMEFIPEQFAIGNKVILGVNDEAKEAGFYSASIGQDSAQIFALNYNRKESYLTFNDAKMLAELMPQSNVNIVSGASTESATAIHEMDKGISLWKWCVIASLLFLATEILLLRYFRKAQ